MNKSTTPTVPCGARWREMKRKQHQLDEMIDLGWIFVHKMRENETER
jgi:hypothetical protein